MIHDGQVLPCIIGDTGPNDICGEGSQRLGRALNPKASGMMSAVRQARVTYVVFPGTREDMGPLNLKIMHDRVQHLLGDLGGLGAGVTLHVW